VLYSCASGFVLIASSGDDAILFCKFRLFAYERIQSIASPLAYPAIRNVLLRALADDINGRWTMSADIIKMDSRRRLESAQAQRQRYFAGQRRRAQELLERIKQTSRLQSSDKPLLAANIGRLVLQTAAGSQEAPDNLARIIFQNAFANEGFLSNWKNRKRFLRFPNEETSDGTKYGDYAGSGKPFQAIAHALIDYLSDQGRNRDRALQKGNGHTFESCRVRHSE
jgi:hypothetical protein